MVKNLIKLNKIKKHLNISFNESSEKIFSNIKSGFFDCPSISFLFDEIKYEISIYEIFDTNSIIEKNKEYNKQSLFAELPKIPENSFIFGADIGGDFFVFNATSNIIYYSGEVTFYKFVELSISIYDLVNNLTVVDGPINFIFKFNNSEIQFLNYINNDILSDFLSDFLSNINYGINDVNFQYSKNNKIFDDKIDFIYGFDYLKDINKDVKNLFLFGKTAKDKEIVLNIKNGNILFKDGTFVMHYKSLFK